MVKIVTDSGGDIPPRIANELDISIVPARVLFGTQSYKDGVELSASRFYDKLRTSKFHPLTTQASPMDFYQIFKEIDDQDEDIIYIHLPRSLSAFVESAQLAKQHFKDSQITFYNSGGVSAFQGIMTIEAGRMAKQGFKTEDILAHIDTIKPKTMMFSIAKTLDYLMRGGRISVTRYRIGTLLSVLPILKINEETVRNDELGFDTQPLGNFDKGIEKILGYLKSEFTDQEPLNCLINHSVNQSGAAKITDLVLNNFNIVELNISRIGATIGANVGPGAIGVALSPSLPFLGE